MRPRTTNTVRALALTICTAGCSADDGGASPAPWTDQRTQVLDEQRSFTQLAPAGDAACLEYEGQCVRPTETCRGQAVDIVLDSAGKPLDYLCYPGASTLSVDALQAEQGEIPQRANNSVLVLDDLADGPDVVGDVVIDANNVVLYGDSADTAVLGGSLTLDGDGALVRGVRIQGDVTILKNNATLAFCVIEGDLVIAGNGAHLLACDVLGSITLSGNNTRLFANRIAGGISGGKNSECKDNVSAADVDGDLLIEPAELGAAVSCP